MIAMKLRPLYGLLTVLILGNGGIQNAQAAVCDPRSLGAIGDGVHDDTPAFQAALDACIGGGTVHVSAGTYAIKPIVFTGNGVTLQLDLGATLQGSPSFEDYDLTGNLILADNKTDLAIIGQGTIDGSGPAFWGQDPRPRLIRFRHCQRVLVQGVTLQNSPSFHLVPQDTDDITIDNVKILAPPDSPNTDGIDPGGKNINISNCYIDTGDDNVVLKAGPGVHVDGVTVRDCTFLHGHGLSMGSELNDGVENFTAQNITFDGTDNGLRIKTDRTKGGIIKNIGYESISMNNVGRIIDIAGYYPEGTVPAAFTDPPQPPTATTPRYSDINVRNLTSTGGGNRSPNGAFFIGVPEAPISGVLMQNVSLTTAARPFELRNVAVQNCNVSVNSGFVIDENATITNGGCGTEDYSLSASPASQTVNKGVTTSYSVTVTPSGGFGGPVNFRVSGLPGTTSTFNPAIINGSGATTLTVVTSNLTPAGTFPLTITATSGTSGRLHRIAVATLVVQEGAPSPDFSLSASPSSQTVTAGLSASYTAIVTPSGGFAGTVGFSVSPLPSGAVATFSPTSVSGSGSSTLTITTSSSTPAGSYPLTITGTSGSRSHTASITLVVQAAGGGDFTISASPISQSVDSGNSITYAVTVGSSGGFAGPVTFSASGVPAGAAATFDPPSVSGSGSSTMTIGGDNLATGSYLIQITGTSGALAHSTSVTLIVN